MQILDFIQNNLRNGFLDIIMRFITHIGDYGIIWFLTAVVLMTVKKTRAVGFAILAALLLCLLVGNLTLKPLIARERPFTVNASIELLIPRPADFSFPSGHTMSSFAAATVIFLANKRFGTVALVLAGAIAFSRLYLYVHYPSDVLAGGLIGIAFGVPAYAVTTKILKKFLTFL